MPAPTIVHAAIYQSTFWDEPSSASPTASRTALAASTGLPPCSPMARPTRGDLCRAAEASVFCGELFQVARRANACLGQDQLYCIGRRMIAREMRGDRTHLFVSRRHQEGRRAAVALDADREVIRFDVGEHL